MSDINVWNNKNLTSLKTYRHFPSEMVLRATISNSYFNDPFLPGKNKSVLDIGCLFANNLIPFFDRGMKLFGTEVTDESVKICQEMCSLQGLQVDVRKGFNTSLPFEDLSFDLILSIATIHYEESLQDVRMALKEFQRVTKRGGTCIIKTIAPKHQMFQQSKKTSNGTYIFNNISDLRNDQKFYFFEDEVELESVAKEYFKTVELARITETYPNRTLDFFLLKCSC